MEPRIPQFFLRPYHNDLPRWDYEVAVIERWPEKISFIPMATTEKNFARGEIEPAPRTPRNAGQIDQSFGANLNSKLSYR